MKLTLAVDKRPFYYEIYTMKTGYDNKAMITNAYSGDHIKAFVRLMVEQGLTMQLMHKKLYTKYGWRGHLGKIIQQIKKENGEHIPQLSGSYSHK